jgi:hypothetical protein
MNTEWHPQCLADAQRQSSTKDAATKPTPATINAAARRIFSDPKTRLTSAPLPPEAAAIINARPPVQKKEGKQ